MNEPRPRFLNEAVMLACIAALAFGVLAVLRPFLPAILWATIIVVATWPMMLRLQRRLGDRRAPAAIIMTLVLLLFFVVPVTLAIATIVANTDKIVAGVKRLSAIRMPTPPDWLANLPFVGPKIRDFWEQAAEAGVEGLWDQVQPYLGAATRWLVAVAGGVGYLVVQALMIVVFAALMYSRGEVGAHALVRFGRRLGGARGADTVVLAGQAIRGVALGVGVTAAVQSALGGIGLAVAGVPFAGLLTAVMFMLCLAQLGPTLVMLPATIWVYWSGDNVWGSVLLVITIAVGTLDNILRPWLIRMGADLPLLLIFGGVIGGLLAFGLVGIFIGPVVLAVAYTLLGAWIDAAPAVGDAGGR